MSIEIDSAQLELLTPLEAQWEAQRIAKGFYKNQAERVLAILRHLGEATYMEIAAVGHMIPTSVDRTLNQLHDNGSPEARVEPFGKQYNEFHGKMIPRTIWRVKR